MIARALFAILGMLPFASAASGDDGAATLARTACAAIASHVDASPADTPVLLASWQSGEGGLEPSLTTAAFVYDNALALIALQACGRADAARRIGLALRAAALAPTRPRNVYRAGPVEGVPLPNGWWDAGAQRWSEDPQQMGTATGNVAWVALSLLHARADDGDPRWLDAARRLGQWALDETATDTIGFSGGIDGFDDAPRRLGWKSTEHNVDLVALFDALSGLGDDARWSRGRDRARAFVDAQWDARAGRFVTGTLVDGVTPNLTTSGLDAQLWPLLLRDADQDWRRVMAFVEREHGVDGGFDFNADRDGLWVEGSAQAALALRVLGREADARRVLAAIARERSAQGYLFATRGASLTTGLALGPASQKADFLYYRRPHLGATAWAALAALGANPFAMPVKAKARTAKERAKP